MSAPTEPRIPGPSEDAVTEFASLPPDATILSAAAALEHNGVQSLVVDSGADAEKSCAPHFRSGSVFSNTSRNARLGVAEDIERSGLYQPLRPTPLPDGP
jgi:hypothetical protein